MLIEYQIELIVRIVISGICGVVIGYERKSRNKEAGIRTHLIVAVGAALMMIVSKYGFNDILGDKGVALDPSRIAAQIVTGVGFLGAGMIFMRRNTISGLTTAAGIWATSGIGMAIASGLYVIGITTTVFIVLVQIVLHGNHKWFHESLKDDMTFLITKDKKNIEDLSQKLRDLHIELLNIKISEQEENYQIEFSVSYPEAFRSSSLLDVFKDIDYMKEMDV